MDLQGKLRRRDAAQPIRSQADPASDPIKSNAPVTYCTEIKATPPSSLEPEDAIAAPVQAATR
jgi:hypothetical protein